MSRNPLTHAAHELWERPEPQRVSGGREVLSHLRCTARVDAGDRIGDQRASGGLKPLRGGDTEVMPDAWDEAAVAAAESNVADQIRDAIFGPLDAAIRAQVGVAALHEVDEAMSMPRVGAVAQALDGIDAAVTEAVGEAVRSATDSLEKPRKARDLG